MDDDELINEIESIYESREPSGKLPDRVHGSVLLVSVFRAIVEFYVNAIAVIGAGICGLSKEREQPGADRVGKE